MNFSIMKRSRNLCKSIHFSSWDFTELNLMLETFWFMHNCQHRRLRSSWSIEKNFNIRLHTSCTHSTIGSNSTLKYLVIQDHLTASVRNEQLRLLMCVCFIATFIWVILLKRTQVTWIVNRIDFFFSAGELRHYEQQRRREKKALQCKKIFVSFISWRRREREGEVWIFLSKWLNMTS